MVMQMNRLRPSYAPEGKGFGRMVTPVTAGKYAPLPNQLKVAGAPELMVETIPDHARSFSPTAARLLFGGEVLTPTVMNLPTVNGHDRLSEQVLSQQIEIKGERYEVQFARIDRSSWAPSQPAGFQKIVGGKTFLSRGDESFSEDLSSSGRLEVLKINRRTGAKTIYRSVELSALDTRSFRITIDGQEVVLGSARALARLSEEKAKLASQAEIKVELIEVSGTSALMQAQDFNLYLVAGPGRLLVGSTANPVSPVVVRLGTDRYEISAEAKRAAPNHYGFSVPTYSARVTRIAADASRELIWSDSFNVSLGLKILIRGKEISILPSVE
jgi:hypothetical protein